MNILLKCASPTPLLIFLARIKEGLSAYLAKLLAKVFSIPKATLGITSTYLILNLLSMILICSPPAVDFDISMNSWGFIVILILISTCGRRNLSVWKISQNGVPISSITLLGAEKEYLCFNPIFGPVTGSVSSIEPAVSL